MSGLLAANPTTSAWLTSHAGTFVPEMIMYEFVYAPAALTLQGEWGEPGTVVDVAFIVRFTGITDKWFYKLIQEGKFPEPIKMGHSSRWLESEVVMWFKEEINESRIE